MEKLTAYYKHWISLKDKKNGFTLVEILVVISIIAVLAAIGLSIYQPVVKRSRDSKRISDLKLIQSSLEDYHADQLYYPAIGTGFCPAESDGRFRVGCPLTSPDRTKKYLNLVPKDPLGTTEYFYMPSGCSSNECRSYCLFANMEGTAPVSEPGCRFPSDLYDFGVSRP